MKPNHKDGCDGSSWRHSGYGYNRVRVCACGAEDHDPTPEAVDSVMRHARQMGRDLAQALLGVADAFKRELGR